MVKIDKTRLRDFRIALVETEGVPEPLSADDPRYVAGLHGENEEDVIQALLDDIMTRSSLGSNLFYFTGQRGTGKSTELRRLQVLLEGEGAQVIRFNSLDFISETEKITVEVVLLLVTAGLAAWADEHYKQEFLASSVWGRFSSWLKTDVELSEVSAFGLKVKLKEQQATVSGKVKALSNPIEWTRKIQEFAEGIVEFIRQQTQRERVVVVVDSLERLRGATGSETASMFDHVVATFAGDVDRLRLPGASVVYSVPPYLSLLSDVRNFVSVFSLAAVRVYDKPLKGLQHSPTRRQPRAGGLAKMRQLITKRFADWPAVLTDEALNKLALSSGGDLRHFLVRLVPDVVGQAQFALDRLPLQDSDEIITRILENNRSETERLTVRDEWPLLRRIAQDHRAVADDRGASLHALAHLLDIHVILNYRNGSEWFDVHPLLWGLVDSPPSPDSLAHGLNPPSATNVSSGTNSGAA